MALKEWFKGKAGPEERVAIALERLVTLYELDLGRRGIATFDGAEEGEVLETSPTLLAKLEAEREYRAANHLGETHPLGAVDPRTGAPWAGEEFTEVVDIGSYQPSLFSSSGSWGFGTGPEGAEEAQPGAAEAWSEELRASGPPQRYGRREVTQREGGADSGPQPQRGGELSSGAVSPEVGELPQ